MPRVTSAEHVHRLASVSRPGRSPGGGIPAGTRATRPWVERRSKPPAGGVTVSAGTAYGSLRVDEGNPFGDNVVKALETGGNSYRIPITILSATGHPISASSASRISGMY